MKIPEILHKISASLNSLDAKAIIVGGSVRDHFLELPIKDYDIEVYGLSSIDELETLLKKYGKVKLVGKSFGVLKFVHEKCEYDFSFPRRETKNGVGHKGFDIISDGFMSFSEASKRRDFTINALGYEMQEGIFLDPFGGISDLKQKKLKHVDDKTFIEDPLRVYRAVQFSARFELSINKDTKKLCKSMVENGDLEELPKERIFEELKKLLLLADKPSVGFEIMREFGMLRYFPELKALIDVQQEPKWHPEGDVWIHTMMCIDEMQGLFTGCPKRDLTLILAVLCHDFGKPSTTKLINGQIRALGHEDAGVEPTENFLKRLTNEVKLVESILPLVKYHLSPSQLFSQNSSDKAIRRLSTKVNLEDLSLVARADFLGRTTEESLTREYKAGDWLLQRASTLMVRKSPPKTLLQGRDLIALGYKPSKEFSKILNSIYELQLEGVINSKDEAIKYLKKEKLCQ